MKITIRLAGHTTLYQTDCQGIISRFTHLTVATTTRDSKLILTTMDSQFETKIAEALKDLQGPSTPSLRAVEKKYGVSRRILQNRLNGNVSKQTALERRARRTPSIMDTYAGK